ncbi:hypothetical protein BpHYR1_033116 [Brachionus plicatilis]|uniref:RNA-directed DNA polymerase from mobile element jockey-like n=1 Tax=Brachionus plicatilis TaxID=10195 RepID=A0A3M7PNL9_BRAPC|nr:hypothetical protein BpHYR1_033116 [Brachionus plicatilis]
MQRHNLEHIIGAGAILNLAHVKFNLTCVACTKTRFGKISPKIRQLDMPVHKKFFFDIYGYINLLMDQFILILTVILKIKLIIQLIKDYISDIQISNSKHSSYSALLADELVAIFYFKKTGKITKVIEKYPSKPMNWLSVWRLKMNASRCVILFFQEMVEVD